MNENVVEIEKYDNLGRGIGYYDEKIIFIPKTAPGDIVSFEIVENKKNYLIGKIKNLIKNSRYRIETKCPYFEKCGGCNLMHVSISEALDYKVNKVNELLKKNDIEYLVKNVVKSSEYYNYRNKVTLKVSNGIIGYYEELTHNIINIDYCFLVNNTINDIIKTLKIMDILYGEIVIRTNYKNEVLIVINSDDDVCNIDYFVENYKVVGIIHNDKCIYGQDYFIDKVNDYVFKVSYNSFFQINPYISSKIFKLVEEYTSNSSSVIDFYSGVGVLGITASKNSQKILGVEINNNAVIDANLNKNINNIKNAEFICSDTKKAIELITTEFDTIILDPPRSGVDNNVIERIKNEKIKKIIYVSCNPLTLIRDLKLLEQDYKIDEITLFDMFPNTEHIECVTLLCRKTL